MKLLIAASGTGGHIFPALAVAEELRDVEITWLGVPGRLEQKLVTGRYPLVSVPLGGLGKPGPAWIATGGQLIQSVAVVYPLLQQGFGGVFTTGSYIAAPALIAARLLGLPVLFHESNALPGKVTRLMARWCTGVGLGFAEASTYLPGATTRWTGTPVRRDCLIPTPLKNLDLPPEAPVVLVMGGSQGARGINRLVLDCALDWLEAGIWIVHLTGAEEWEHCKTTLTHPHYLPLPFWQEMGPLLYRADLVVSRAGAMTLTELCATGRPSLLIPYPYAAEDHQTFNARILVEQGAALLFQEAQLTAPVLGRTVFALMNDQASRQAMGRAAQGLFRQGAAQEMAHWIRNAMNVGS